MAGRPKVKLTVGTEADPALVEVDGVLIGTTPLADHTIFAGDHVLTISKPGYRRISKRLLIEKDSRIDVPMLRVELSADEIKTILDKADLDIVSGFEPVLTIHTIE
jgi:hypothetical protein